MSKYDPAYEYRRVKPPVVDGETILLELRPMKNAFVLNKILGMMPIAVIWLCLDSIFIVNALGSPMNGVTWFLIPFFALHLMPVWIWLANVLTANRRWKNTTYYVTDRRIIIQTGFLERGLQTVYYKDIQDINLRVGLIDRFLGVGDIYFDTGRDYTKGKMLTKAFLDLDEPQKAYDQIQKIVMDIQTDIHFPNAYRPEENPGYRTRYRG